MRTFLVRISIFICFINSAEVFSQSDRIYLNHKIPAQKFDVDSVLGKGGKGNTRNVRELIISDQITLRQYKEYLSSIKVDSSEVFYLSQLPDSSIGNSSQYSEYLTEPKYEDFPVVGVSWDDALNYCKWRTLKNLDEPLKYVYRLPTSVEWISAWHYYNTNSKINWFETNYSDWLLDVLDESMFMREPKEDSPFIGSYMYFHDKEDVPAMKRKIVIGDSYLRETKYPLQQLIGYYADHGYREVGFRMVLEPLEHVKEGSVSDKLIHFWNINHDVSH